MTEVKVKHWQSFKHNLIWETKFGKLLRTIVGELGLKFLRLGRRLLAWSSYRCSWCGLDPGMGELSNKGMRCFTGRDRSCNEMPKGW